MAQSAKLGEERKTYDIRHSNQLLNLKYNTLENLNQGRANFQEAEAYLSPSSNLIPTYNHNIEGNEFEKMSQKYSKKEIPGNVQDVINKVNWKKSHKI